MKKQLLVAAVAVAFFGTVGVVGATAKDKEPKEDKKVTICHATSAVQNQWVRTVVSENATAGHFDNNGTAKAGHEGDKLLQGDVDCPVVDTPPVVVDQPGGKEEPKTPEVNTPKTDTPVVEKTTPTPVEEPVYEEFQGK